MKSNLLQSQLHRNATTITMLTKQLCEAKADAKGAQLAASRRHHRAIVVKLSAKVSKLAAIQKGIKFDLLATKLARPTVRRKHDKTDQRYIDWAMATGKLTNDVRLITGMGEGIGGAAPAQMAA